MKSVAVFALAIAISYATITCSPKSGASAATADITPYPVQKGQTHRVEMDVTLDAAATVSKVDLKKSFLTIGTIVLDNDTDCSAGVSCHLEGDFAAPSLPLSGVVDVDAVVITNTGAQPAKATCPIQVAAVAPVEEENASCDVYTLCPGVTDHLGVDSLVVQPCPVQKGKQVCVTAVGVPKESLHLTLAKVNIASTITKEVKIDVSCNENEKCSAKVCSDTPYIPFISSASIQADIFDDAGVDEACIKLTLPLWL